MRIVSRWIVTVAAAAAVVAGVNSALAQQTIRVGWTIPAEDSKYWMMRRPAEFPDLAARPIKVSNGPSSRALAPMTQALAAGAHRLR